MKVLYVRQNGFSYVLTVFSPSFGSHHFSFSQSKIDFPSPFVAFQFKLGLSSLNSDRSYFSRTNKIFGPYDTRKFSITKCSTKNYVALIKKQASKHIQISYILFLSSFFTSFTSLSFFTRRFFFFYFFLFFFFFFSTCWRSRI